MIVPTVLAFLVGACGGATPVASLNAAQLTTIQEVDRLVNTTVTPEENALLVNAHGEVVESCMQALGWDFEVDTATPDIAVGGPSTLSKLEQWTFADQTTAESNGYGLEAYVAERAAFVEKVQAGDRTARIPDRQRMSPADSLRFKLDYFGRDEERVEIVERDGSITSIPGGGCLGKATRAVYEDIKQKLRLDDARTTAQSQLWGRVLADGAVGAARELWKRCVAERGFNFEDPENAFDAALTAAFKHDRDRERLVATTTASCTASSRLGAAVEAAFLSAANAGLSDLEDDLVAFHQFEKDALARAKRILGSGG